MEEGPTEYFTSLVKETKEKAEHAIKVKLPQKICDLNTYIESIQHELLQMEEVSTVDNKKDIVPCNDRIVELNAKLKEEMADFLDIFDSDLFNSLEAGKNSAVEVFASLTSYHQVRAKNILSSRQNLEVVDLIQSVKALDNAHYITLCQGFRDLRNAYSTILDKIDKNYDKLVDPKGTSSRLQHELMY
ncbi:hypothetical protein AV274_1166 [Blastocystis sp. ATCC 50177/Nand II]|uniref:Proteasome activator PA28 C-terminal domain-containing protein n=1 Tax=Blastocystis sp. subtype 1 (strain ATCC 50177 / NandII) TaxID=478820 RepID=A0A196SJC2_BLAHN|nr:hypothetical protein AV274_1166 [Blastocystis sp. ATCC 50177/Nand II]